MKKYIVLSVNSNPDYLYFVPLVCWAWEQFNWEPILLYAANSKKSEVQIKIDDLVGDYSFFELTDPCLDMTYFEHYRSSTVAQISRLYAACQCDDDDDFIMTGDCDLIPLSDYWHPDLDSKTVYGFDLTDYTEYPICFVAMKAKYWREVMKLTDDEIEYNIKRDLDEMPNAKSDDFYKWWGVDQQLITQRLKPFNPTLVNRGKYPNGYAVGRMDRSAWNYNHSQFIDMHCFQQLYFKQNQDKFDKTMELLTSIWPDEDFTWFLLYTKEFQKLTGHA